MGLTLVVAFCSVAYELLFCQALTLIFGNAAAQFGLAIGLYLFALGVGAFLSARVAHTLLTLFATLVGLAITGPAGLVGLYLLNGAECMLSPAGQAVSVVLSHAPVVAVGLLAGVALPLLAVLQPAGIRGFYQVLGWDYLGSLVGAVVFALWLYPAGGLFGAAVLVGCVCAGAAAAVALFGMRSRAVAVALLASMALLGWWAPDFGERLTRRYLGASILQRYWGRDIAAESVEVTDEFTTRYQHVVVYRLSGAAGDELCLNLDGHVQMCESWVDSYHHGLVDVPVAFFDPEQPLDVLLLGGGDFIPLAYLATHANVVRVDQVDIDPELTAFARESELLRRYHRDAFATLSGWRLSHEDALTFLRHNRHLYDLILFDLPGLIRGEMLPLASVEMFAHARRALKAGGIAASWGYPPDIYPMHAAILTTTLAAAGFEYQVPYFARGRTGAPGGYFFALARDETPRLRVDASDYVAEHERTYAQLMWLPVMGEATIQPNSVLAPNLDLLVPSPRGARPRPVGYGK